MIGAVRGAGGRLIRPENAARKAVNDALWLNAHISLPEPYCLILEPANDPLPRSCYASEDSTRATRMTAIEVIDYHGPTTALPVRAGLRCATR